MKDRNDAEDAQGLSVTLPFRTPVKTRAACLSFLSSVPASKRQQQRQAKSSPSPSTPRRKTAPAWAPPAPSWASTARTRRPNTSTRRPSRCGFRRSRDTFPRRLHRTRRRASAPWPERRFPPRRRTAERSGRSWWWASRRTSA